MSGRTTWYAEDAAWHRRELIVEIGEEFGAGGVLVMKVFRAWAQEQRSNGCGKVRGGFRSLAREAFVTVADARAVVEGAAAIGALDDLEVDQDGRRFTCRVSGWTADQERGRAAFRKEKQRASHGSEHIERDMSRIVTPSTQPNQTIEVLPPLPPQGGRDRDKQQFDDDLARWAQEFFPDANPRHVGALASWLRGRDVEPTPENMRAFAREHTQWSPGIVEVAV